MELLVGKFRFPWLAMGLAMGLVISGCGLWQPSPLSQCQAEKKQVMGKVVSQQRQIDELESQRQRLAERLSEAEKQLALLHDQTPNRLAEGRRPAATARDDRPTREPPASFRRETATPNEWSPRQRRD